MTVVDGFKAAVLVSLVFSWIALLIALVPSLLVTSVAGARRWHYAIAGLMEELQGDSAEPHRCFSVCGSVAEVRFKGATLHRETWG
jgi:hypothetical protein